MIATVNPATYYQNLDTTYQTVVINSGATTYSFTRATGRLNRVTVSKVNSNPYGRGGKDFPTFDAAQEAYRQPLVKTMVLLAESLLK